MDTKGCTKCQKVKPVSEFYLRKGKPGSWCKSCYALWHRTRHAPASGATDEPRDCEVCGKAYQPKTRRPSTYCSRDCKAVQRRESGQAREQHLVRKYGITQADYDRMLTDQGGGCALCSAKPEDLTAGRYRTYLHVDHCHDTGKVRGLLCPDCNLLIGRRPNDWFRRAADYLER